MYTTANYYCPALLSPFSSCDKARTLPFARPWYVKETASSRLTLAPPRMDGPVWQFCAGVILNFFPTNCTGWPQSRCRRSRNRKSGSSTGAPGHSSIGPKYRRHYNITGNSHFRSSRLRLCRQPYLAEACRNRHGIYRRRLHLAYGMTPLWVVALPQGPRTPQPSFRQCK